MELKFILESLLFSAQKPLSPAELREVFANAAAAEDADATVKSLKKIKEAELNAALEELVKDHEAAGRSYRLACVAGSWQFVTQPDYAPWLKALVGVKARPSRLSQPALETLAIIAYRQPVTRPEIDEIRGVDSGSTIKVLLDRSLIRVLGKKEEPGRPLLYGTSKEFLEFFNLRELRDLPSLREFHELTEESLREVEALDQAGKEDAAAEEGASAGSNGAGGEPEGDDPDDDSSSASAPH
jgi:segregation and condensation protein B